MKANEDGRDWGCVDKKVRFVMRVRWRRDAGESS
jgi:hypothetical protein